MDYSTSSHLSSKPQYPKILVTTMLTNLSPNSVWLFKMAKRLASKHATTCCMRLMWWLIITASLASLALAGSRRHVFFGDQGGRILVSSPSIRWSGPRQPAYTWLRRLSFMESRHCPLSSCRLWLSSVYSLVWALTWRETPFMLVSLWSSRLS